MEINIKVENKCPNNGDWFYAPVVNEHPRMFCNCETCKGLLYELIPVIINEEISVYDLECLLEMDFLRRFKRKIDNFGPEKIKKINNFINTL